MAQTLILLPVLFLLFGYVAKQASTVTQAVIQNKAADVIAKREGIDVKTVRDKLNRKKGLHENLRSTAASLMQLAALLTVLSTLQISGLVIEMDFEWPETVKVFFRKVSQVANFDVIAVASPECVFAIPTKTKWCATMAFMLLTTLQAVSAKFAFILARTWHYIRTCFVALFTWPSILVEACRTVVVDIVCCGVASREKRKRAAAKEKKKKQTSCLQRAAVAPGYLWGKLKLLSNFFLLVLFMFMAGEAGCCRCSDLLCSVAGNYKSIPCVGTATKGLDCVELAGFATNKTFSDNI